MPIFSSLLIVGLLTVSIPIIIHLLHRQKTTPLRWGAMMFLKESPLQMKRRKNIDQWLLLLLRMAALAFLAWMLSRPFFNAAKIIPGVANESVDVAVVIDHSMSMGRHHGDHTLFDEARGVVDELTDPQTTKLHNGDTVSVVLAEHSPRKFTPTPVPLANGGLMNQLHADLNALRPGTTDCTIPEAIEVAREVVSHGPNLRKVVLVISDQQKDNWNIGDFAAWRRAIGDDSPSGKDRHIEIHSYTGLVADTSASNVSIEDMKVQPTTVGVNRPVQITAKVSNSGPKEVGNINVHFSVNDKEEGAPQNIPSLGAGQSVTVRFDHTFTTPGSMHVRVWTDVVDALAADNSAVAAVRVWQKLPVLIIDGALTSSGDFKSSMFLDFAMQPDEEHLKTELIQPKIVGAADSAGVNLDDYYVVVLNDVSQLPTSVQEKLGDYVSAGHGLWVILGPRTNPKFLASLGNKSQDMGHALFTADLKQQTPHEEKGAPASVQIKEPNNPMVHVVAEAGPTAMQGVIATKWWPIIPHDADSKVVLATSTGDPLIVDRPMGAGQVAVWTTSADGSWNNWQNARNFTPLVQETIYRLSSPQTRHQNSGNLDAGDSITWAGPAKPAVKTVNVTLPDGSSENGLPAIFRGGHWEFTYLNAFMPGLYTLHFEPTEVEQPVYYGVGINRRELDPTVLSAEDVAWLTKGNFLDKTNPTVDSGTVSVVITRVPEDTDLWKYLAGFVLLSMLFETYMTYRMAGHQKKIDVANAGLVRA